MPWELGKMCIRDRYTFWDVVYQPLRMTEQELAQGVAFVYDKFYSPEGVNKRMSLIKKNVLRSERRAAVSYTHLDVYKRQQ